MNDSPFAVYGNGLAGTLEVGKPAAHADEIRIQVTLTIPDGGIPLWRSEGPAGQRSSVPYMPEGPVVLVVRLDASHVVALCRKAAWQGKSKAGAVTVERHGPRRMKPYVGKP